MKRFFCLILFLFLIILTSCRGNQEYTVTFDTNGGTPVESVTVIKGQRIPTPEETFREGYTFLGWYYGDEQWNFMSDYVTEDITLVAKWDLEIKLTIDLGEYLSVIYTNQMFTLNPTLYPLNLSQDFIFMSSNDDVATVDEFGVVKGQSAGFTTIKVISKINESYYEQFLLEVIEFDEVDTYTYKTWTTSLGDNWNPHTWKTSNDDLILSYLSSPFVTMSIKDSIAGEYQWIYEMATEVVDTTETNYKDLEKFGSTLPAGVENAADVKEGYVFDIKLNQSAKWENGDPIDADDYIYSMQMLLDSSMKNSRADLYIAGESAIAGAMSYYNSGSLTYSAVVPAYGIADTPDYSFDVENNDVYINLTTTSMTLANYSFNEMKAYLGSLAGDYQTLLDTLAEDANAYGYIKVTEENYDTVIAAMDLYCYPFGISIYNGKEVNKEYFMEFLFYISDNYDKVEYDTVGLYKVDQYTIRYVLQNYQDYNYFLKSLTSNWLVHKETYENGFDTTSEVKTTNYGTSKDTTMSYGPYKLETLEEDKRIVLVQNENWFGYTKNEDGSLYSETNFLVDGKKVQQYQTTKVIIDVLNEVAAKQRFLGGELSEWTPSDSELSQYTLSDQLYQAEEIYTMSLFFNTDLDDLRIMDESKGNVNSVVLSNINFRNAFSLAINRAQWVTTTAGYKPTYSLLNDLYYYDIYNDPSSKYRGSDEAMQAICNLYGVKYGDGEVYPTLKVAYDSITGYNLAEAKALMETALEELVEAGLYTAGEEIKINIAWDMGALTSDDYAQVALLERYINEAASAAGFGKITLTVVGYINDRYGAVPAGEYAIGYGAWGGIEFDPFRIFQVYMDPFKYDVNEFACWDPTTETFTLEVEGEEYTMTYQEWSNSLIGSGLFAESSFETQLYIAACLEEQFLKFYYRIPLASSTSCFLLSYQVDYYTKNYNSMYDFGGLRLMTYNYNDAEWAKYVKSQYGRLEYN